MTFWQDVTKTCKPPARSRDPFAINDCVDRLAAKESKCPFDPIDRLTFDELKCAFTPVKDKPEKRLLCLNAALRKSQTMLDELWEANEVTTFADKKNIEKKYGLPYPVAVQRATRKCVSEGRTRKPMFYQTQVPQFPGVMAFMHVGRDWDKLDTKDKTMLLDNFVNAAHSVGTLADFVVEGGWDTLERLFVG